MTRNEYEKNIRSLIGYTITAVVYHEIEYSDGEYHFFDDPRFDSLDFGLEFELDAGSSVSVTWGSEFYHYGVSLIKNEMCKILSKSHSRDVSNTERWKTILPGKIESTEVFWSWCEESANPETRIYYPQDLLLSFAGNKKIVISALEIRADGSYMGMMDNIIVFDELEMAKNYRCLENA